MQVGDYYEEVFALVYILMTVCGTDDISRFVIPVLETIGPGWASCLDRHQVLVFASI